MFRALITLAPILLIASWCSEPNLLLVTGRVRLM